jgi:hypothetical protein
VLGHSFLEHLFEDGLHALTDSGFHVQLDVMLKLICFSGVKCLPSRLKPTNYRTLIGEVATCPIGYGQVNIVGYKRIMRTLKMIPGAVA